MELQFVADREAYDGAAALIAEFGPAALAEAAARAERGRGRDNPISYARWCRVGRTILVLGSLFGGTAPAGATH